jgi:hypothetical protein
LINDIRGSTNSGQVTAGVSETMSFNEAETVRSHFKSAARGMANSRNGVPIVKGGGKVTVVKLRVGNSVSKRRR